MRQWQGIRDDLSVVSDEGLLTATNVSLQIGGELRRRPGLSGRVDETGTLVTEWTDPFATSYLVYNSGAGTLRAVATIAGTETTVSSGLTTLNRGCFTKSNGRLYFCNDFNSMQRIERGNSTGGTVGIIAPTAAIGTPALTSGSTTVGTHGMRYRYYDSKSLYMSDPSDQTNITLTGTSVLTFSVGTSGTTIIRSTDTKVDQVIVELTDAGSSTFYRASTFNQTLSQTTVSMDDTTLRLQVTAARDGDFNHQPPPLFALVTEHRGRLFGWGSTVVTLTGVTVSSASTNITVTGATMSSGWAGRLIKVGSDTKAYRIDSMSGTGVAVLSETYTGTSVVSTGVQFFSATPDMLYWSRAGFPEAWNSLNFARRVLQNASDTPSAFFSHHEVLYLCGQQTIRVLDYASDPASGQLVQVPGEMGVWNQRCVVFANGRVYAWGRSGAWSINGLMPVHLSRAIDDRIDGSDSSSTDNIDVSKFEKFHGVYDPRERVITWFYCTSSDDLNPLHAIRYDLDSKEWTLATWKQAMQASCLVAGGTTNVTRALLADTNGYSWYITPNSFDGVPVSMSGGVVTVSSTGATTTSVPVTQSLPTGTTDLKGVMLYTSSGDEALVASNTANTLTLSTGNALATAPSNGTELYLGVIPFTIKTKWTSGGGIQDKKRPQYLMISKVPGTSAGNLTVTIYLDYSTSAYVFTKGQSDVDPDGITTTNGSANATVDLDGGSGDGVVFLQMPADWSRVISAQITSYRPTSTIKLLDVKFTVTNSRNEVTVMDE